MSVVWKETTEYMRREKIEYMKWSESKTVQREVHRLWKRKKETAGKRSASCCVS
jgi:hypothetical protein